MNKTHHSVHLSSKIANGNCFSLEKPKLPQLRRKMTEEPSYSSLFTQDLTENVVCSSKQPQPSRKRTEHPYPSTSSSFNEVPTQDFSTPTSELPRQSQPRRKKKSEGDAVLELAKAIQQPVTINPVQAQPSMDVIRGFAMYWCSSSKFRKWRSSNRSNEWSISNCIKLKTVDLQRKKK